MTIVIVVFKQKTAYEMRISDWSSDVCSSDLQLVDVRTQLFAVDSMRAGAVDDYALVRDAWLQRRNYQIFGEREQAIDESLPEYLREDRANPPAPVAAMPLIPAAPPPRGIVPRRTPGKPSPPAASAKRTDQ